MSYLASMYREAPQQISITGGSTAAIPVTVDTNYSRITVLGWAGDNGGGTVTGSRFRVSFSSGSQLTSSGSATAIVVVEYFHRRFFRQAFRHATVTIATTATSGNDAHGLTLGSKAFVVANGHTSDRTLDGGSALQEAQVLAKLSLSGANVTATCVAADYAGGPGSVIVNYTLIDPK